jgi:hypothetical protein
MDERSRYWRTPEAFEIFGRLATAIFDITSLRGSTARGVNVWVRLGGGFAVSWTGGPHAREIADELVAIADDEAMTDVLLPGDVVNPDPTAGGRLILSVRGMPVELEGLDTTGISAELAVLGSRSA